MKLALLLALLVATTAAYAEPITGIVTRITDGDTLTLLTPSKEQLKVRLNQIDAPESSQAFGQKSKEALSHLCVQKNATLTHTNKDRYGRTLADVNCAGVDANREMVRLGMAWVYDQYVRDKSLYTLQDSAKQAKTGLWSDPAAIAPWEYRHGPKLSKPKTPASITISNTSTAFSCGSKRYCKEMSSCAEATFYLQQCGLSRLDRDKDGIPCESLCR